MNSALRYLLVTSFTNAVLFRLKRLRQPKYLAGAILGGFYFYFYFYRFLMGGGDSRSMSPLPAEMPDQALTVEIAAAVLFVATLCVSWIMPASRAAIQFTEAEIAWLFPAPLKRHTLIIHKLLRSQLTLLFIALFFTFFTGRFRAGNVAWLHMGGWWVILTTLSMHRIGASFTLQRLRERGLSDRTRRFGALLVLAALIALFEFWRRSLPAAPSISKQIQVGNLLPWLEQVLQSGPAPWVLGPFRIVVSPFFAQDLPTFLIALGPALLMMAAHFWWVVRADVSFEDASIEAAQKRSALLAARSRGELRIPEGKAKVPLFQLRPTGFVPMAFFWKFFIKVGGRVTMRRGFLAFCALAAISLTLNTYPVNPHTNMRAPLVFTGLLLVNFGCYIAVVISLVMVGQSAATQLRRGMAGMDLLKTYPIPGWHIALGELLGPIVLGTLLQFAVLLVVLPSFWNSGELEPAMALALACCALLLPSFNLSLSILPCATALLFPGWIKPQEHSTPSVEATGLRLVSTISQMLALLIGLLPAGFFGLAAWFALGKCHVPLPAQLLFSTATASLVLALEAGLGVAWLGRLYERFDVAGE